VTEKQKEIQRILGRNRELNRHVRTCEKLFEISKERANRSIDKEVEQYYRNSMINLKEYQIELKESMQITEKLINLVPDKTLRDILMLYHVACLTMDEVAETIHYERSTTWLKYGQALNSLSIVLDSESMIE